MKINELTKIITDETIIAGNIDFSRAATKEHVIWGDS
jgi:hypothetical protein